MARVQSVFSARRNDRAEGGEHNKHGKHGKHGKVAMAAEPAADTLEFHEFLEALVRLSFSRANPRFGEAGHERDAPNPLPECLEQMLQKNLMPTATRERLWTWREAVVHEPTVQVVLWSFKPQLTRHYERLVGGGPIDASDSPGAAPAAAAAAASPATTLVKPGNGVSQLPFEAFLHDLTARKITRELTVRPLSGVAGTRLPPIRLGLSLLDAKAAFFTALDFERHGQDGDQGGLDFDEFVVALALCGAAKFDIDEMSLPQRVGGIFEQYLGDKDELAILTAAVVPPVQRFDAARDAAPLAGQSMEEYSHLLECWRLMDLSRVPGFPIWLSEVFHELQARAWANAQSQRKACAEPAQSLLKARTEPAQSLLRGPSEAT